MFVMEWYNWAAIGVIVVILVGYKLYKNKFMT